MAQEMGPSPAEACASVVRSAATLNGPSLFVGATSCAQAERAEDTNFLILVGQIRAISDLTILTPSDEANTMRAGQIYAQLYYQFGGLGFDEVYRTAAGVSTLERRVRAVSIVYSAGYDPGWSYRASSKVDIYDAIVVNTREQRLWQMRSMALRLQNDEYYAAHRALTELQRANPTFQEGTPAYEELGRLDARMEAAARGIPEIPQPEDTTPYARLNEPDPDLMTRQVASGFNGPASTETYLFRSEEEVRGSWLGGALPASELAALVERTDFSRQWLVALSVGRRMNASSEIRLSSLDYSSTFSSYSIGVRIGVISESCGVAFAASYPFVVGVVDAVPGAEVRGNSMSNFPAECGAIMSAEPTPE
ncbi:MAG TPA: hypothetical protein PLN53_05650 [Terricaulis sp.]|nr:hypothetical protein [Terricaulis sp.]